MKGKINNIKTKLKNIPDRSKKIIVLATSIILFVTTILISFSFWNKSANAITLVSNKIQIPGQARSCSMNEPTRWNFTLSNDGLAFCADPGYTSNNSMSYYKATLTFKKDSDGNLTDDIDSLTFGKCPVNSTGSSYCGSRITYGGGCGNKIQQGRLQKMAVVAYYGKSKGATYRAAAQAIIWELATGTRTAAIGSTDSVDYSKCANTEDGFKYCRPNKWDGTTSSDTYGDKSITTYYETVKSYRTGTDNQKKLAKAYAWLVKKLYTYCSANDCSNFYDYTDDIQTSNDTATIEKESKTVKLSYNKTEKIFKGSYTLDGMDEYTCSLKSDTSSINAEDYLQYEIEDNVLNVIATDSPTKDKQEKKLHLVCKDTSSSVYGRLYGASAGSTSQYMIAGFKGSATKEITFTFSWEDFKFNINKAYSDNIGDVNARPIFEVQGYFNQECTDRSLPSKYYNSGSRYNEKYRITCNDYTCTKFKQEKQNEDGTWTTQHSDASVVHVDRDIYYKVTETSSGSNLYKIGTANVQVVLDSELVPDTADESSHTKTFTNEPYTIGYKKVSINPVTGAEYPLAGAQFYSTSSYGGAGMNCQLKMRQVQSDGSARYVIRKSDTNAASSTAGLDFGSHFYCPDRQATYVPSSGGTNAREFVHYYSAYNPATSTYTEGPDSDADNNYLELPTGRPHSLYGAATPITAVSNKLLIGGIYVNVPVIAGDATQLAAGGIQAQNRANTVYVSGADGMVNMSGVREYSATFAYTYKIFEYNAPNMYTLANANDNYLFTINASETAVQKAINYPTELEFTKTDCENGNEQYSSDATELLKTAEFEVRDANNNPVPVCQVQAGVYFYTGSGQCGSAGATTKLRINDNRKFKVYYLPWGTYNIVETKKADGYFHNKKSSNTATINQATSSSTVGGSVPQTSLIDQSVKIYFNKNDYENCITTENGILSSTQSKACNASLNTDNYYTNQDNATTDSDVKLLDTALFVIYDATTKQYIQLRKYDANTGVSNARYKLLGTGDIFNPNTDTSLMGNHGAIGNASLIHTINGQLEINRLYADHEYHIEEVKSTDPSNFILPDAPNHPEISYGNLQEKYDSNSASITTGTVCPEESKGTVTAVINNIPTRVVVEKRDSKYWTIIDDNTTTFQLFKCNNDECTDRTQINLYDKKKIYNTATGKYELAYQYSKLNAPSQTGKTIVQDLHPIAKGEGDDENIGKVIVRYLPAGKYVFVETKSPKGYNLPTSPDNEAMVEVSGTTADVEANIYANRPTQILVQKFDQDLKKLTGAEFVIYKIPADKYNKNWSSKKNVENYAVDKNGNHVVDEDGNVVPLLLQVVREGEYEYYDPYQTYNFTTCNTQENCDAITEHLNSQSVKKDYENGGYNSFAYNVTKMEVGDAIIQYLDYENYYVVREVKAPSGVNANSAYGYSLDSENAYSEAVYIPKSDENNYDQLTIKMINEFTKYEFYKYDEFNKLVDGAQFKLQKLDDNKVYHDVYVRQVTHEESPTMVEADEYVYMVTGIEGSSEINKEVLDELNTNTIIETTGGKGKIFLLTEGQYRIVETKAPEGKELPIKNLNVATFFVTSDGEIKGNNIISNKAPTAERKTSLHSSQAEFILNIQTGMTYMRYGLVIAAILVFIVLLFKGKKKIK